MVRLWFLVALVRGKTSGDGFEGVMRIESPRPSDWHAIGGSMMLGHACTVQLKAQGRSVTVGHRSTCGAAVR